MPDQAGLGQGPELSRPSALSHSNRRRHNVDVRERDEFKAEPTDDTPAPFRLNRIMVGLDGSDDSHRAATYAADLAKKTGASIVAVHAVGLLEHVGNAGAAMQTSLATEWVAPFRTAGVMCEHRLAEGPPAGTIAALAQQLGVDLVVVGTRGAGNTIGVIGSTASKLVGESTVPVLVVPRPSM